ncbi:uncharacterized protein E0L32_001879 [Thyridium curvatum]|uniref:Signal peptidase subunit 3 n=1 Tax=Thyridium curvatum TaxID=1093900 RepID=A0A507AFD0_9PEZI|nr:uncharacterized protein E0L32_001800 [Thyridium curvatum]XP_030990015.1 uncharacterized protein E0L32_001879 [Thyridium curvatum]TPX08225.1 hypothetical protein E0L32_001800 [Thyridium curvatum]TPX08304.1 hypothetical protein E0L32_001879 [Thyridium curvatum]
MYSSLVRAQNTFGFFTTVAGFLALVIALSDLIAPRTPSVGTIKTTNVQVTKQVFVYVTAEWPSVQPGHASSPSSNATNQAVIWDTIITSPSADHLQNIGPIAMKKLRKSAEGKSIDPSRGLLRLKNQKPKYQITHPSGRIAEAKDVTLRLHYNVQPWVGILTWNQDRDYGLWERLKGGVSKKFALPALKKKEGQKA